MNVITFLYFSFIIIFFYIHLFILDKRVIAHQREVAKKKEEEEERKREQKKQKQKEWNEIRLKKFALSPFFSFPPSPFPLPSLDD